MSTPCLLARVDNNLFMANKQVNLHPQLRPWEFLLSA